MIRRAFLLVVVLALGLVAAVGSVSASGPVPSVIYDSTVTPLPGNLLSQAFEATSMSEFGDEITFAGTDRTLTSVTVTLSSWACEEGNWYTAGSCVTTPGDTFSVPITFTIYQAGSSGAVGSLIATTTQTFNVPYRPSSDSVNCDGTAWYDAAANACYRGLATNIVFNFSSQGLQLPDTVVYGISFNTTHYGPSPIGESAACFGTAAGCPYDSLNVALSPTVVIGSKPYPDTTYLNSSWTGAYCDNGTAGTGTFRLDSPTSACWTGYVPAVQFQAMTIVGPPTSKSQCMNGGWMSFNNPSFKNQGDCVSFVATNGRNPGNG